jgi:hypothetical protein
VTWGNSDPGGVWLLNRLCETDILVLDVMGGSRFGSSEGSCTV